MSDLGIKHIPNFNGFDLFAPEFEGCPSAYFDEITRYGFLEHVQPGDTFVELGACFGAFPLVLNKHFGNSITYIGVEPHPVNYAAALLNFYYNKVPYKLLNVAVSNSRQSLRFFKRPPFGIAACSQVSNDSNDILVPTVKLEDILPPKVDIFLCDIEGHEWYILDDFPKCRSIFVELHYNLDRGSPLPLEVLESKLSQLADYVLILHNPHFIPSRDT